MPPLRNHTAWLQGEPFRCLQPPAATTRPWRLILLGPPGVGKGTQSAMLATVLGACPLSTADIFRAGCERSFAPGSAMATAEEHMNRGELVPDDLVLGLLRSRRACLRCGGGFLLDGFPRTITQAIALDGMLTADRLPLDGVISYDLPLPVLVERMTGRRVCPHCHALFHVTSRPPRHSGICNYCGGRLSQRADDKPAAVRKRLEVYAEATAQVAGYYERRRRLVRIEASGSPEQILLRTLKTLAALGFDVPLTITPHEAETAARPD